MIEKIEAVETKVSVHQHFTSVAGNRVSDSSPIPFPPDPSTPTSGDDDPTLDPNWPTDDARYKMDHSGYMQILMEKLNYIDQHPNDIQAGVIFAKVVSRLLQRNLLTSGDQQWLDQANPVNLMKDAVDHNMEYAYLMGYDPTKTPPSPDPATAGTWTAVHNYLSALQSALQQIQGGGKYIQGMLDEISFISTPDFKSQFIISHEVAKEEGPQYDAWGNVMHAGDIVWSWTDPTTGKTAIYDWTAAYVGKLHPGQDQITMDTITSLIDNSDGATGNYDHADINYLDSQISGMQAMDFLNTFDAILKMTGGDVGQAILGALYAMQGDELNKLGGNADVMDKQHKLNKMAKDIEDYFKQFGSTGAPSASDLRGTLQALFATIGSSSQFTGLADAVSQAVSTLNTTMLPWAKGGAGAQRSVWDLITDPTVSNDDLDAALHAGLEPSDKSQSPSEALQGVLGGIDGVVTAVTSASTQANTISSQLQALIQAIDKPMTGVIDPKMGIDTGVIATTINHQTG